LNSVSALQVGLTAARCAETTAVAVQFAGNVLSLVQFGVEVQQRGLLHGLMVMGKELVLLHTMEHDEITARQRRRDATKYTHAALGAVESAQRVSRNVQNLVQDENLEHVLQPIFWFAGTVSGYGWLWGKNEEVDAAQQQTATEGQPDADAAVASTNEDASSSANTKTKSEAGPATGVAKAEEIDRLSDLMEEIVEAFGEGLLTPIQKNDLCERLTNVSGNDSAAFDEIEKSLRDYMKEQKKEIEIVSATAPAVETFVSSSSVMELVLAAYYGDLITPNEKAELCQRIAGLSSGQEGKDALAMAQISQTLKELLEKGKGKTSGPSVQELLSLEDEFTSDLDQHDTQQPRTDPNAVAQGREETETSDMNERLALTISNSRTSDQDNSTEQRGAEDKKQGEAWMRLGMATLSVVVGGLLSSQQENESTSNNQERNQSDNSTGAGTAQEANFTNPGSSVQIVEIEDDAEEEWVSVPQ